MVERHVIQDLNYIRVFAKVADLRSVTGAARILGMPKSSVSRSLARLEANIGASLLHRSNRRIELTDTGAVFYRHALEILGEIEEAEAALGQVRSTPQGLLRVSAPFTSGHTLLAPLLPAFLERYPDIQISLDLDNRRVDLLTDDIDVAIRVGRLEDSSLTVRKLATVELALFASPAYLGAHPTLRMPADLSDHAAVVDHVGDDNGEQPKQPSLKVWTLEGPGGRASVVVRPRLFVNDPSTVRLAVLGGLGLGWLPSFLALKDVDAGRLVSVLPGYRRPSVEIHALFPGRRFVSPKVRAFVDYLAANLAPR